MAKINTYAADASVTGGEKLLSSDVGGNTVNISIDTVAEYYGNNNSVSVGGQANFRFTTATINNMSSGYIGGGTASGTNFSAITSLVFSKNTIFYKLFHA